MKKSTITALVLVTLYIGGAIICDFALAAKYTMTRLDDPMKNFSQVSVKSFAILDLSGGNGYAIEIRQGSAYHIMLMNSRKSFFKMKESGDTLRIRFGVANQSYQSPQSCVVGLIITVPTLSTIKLSGTNNILGPFKGDSLRIFQDGKTLTRINNTRFLKLSLGATQESMVDFGQHNIATDLELKLENKASLTMNGISFETFKPVVKDSARLIFFGKPLDAFKKNQKSPLAPAFAAERTDAQH